jgi:hypothetical protein
LDCCEEADCVRSAEDHDAHKVDSAEAVCASFEDTQSFTSALSDLMREDNSGAALLIG